MGLTWRRQVLEILIEETGCILQDLELCPLLLHIALLTVLWHHWSFSSSDIPNSFPTWGLCSRSSCCLEYTSLSSQCQVAGSSSFWPAHLSVLQGFFSDHSNSNSSVAPSQSAYHSTSFYSLCNTCPNVLVHVGQTWEPSFSLRNTGAQNKFEWMDNVAELSWASSL